eukprot:940309-Rhodomonas_salina.2
MSCYGATRRRRSSSTWTTSTPSATTADRPRISHFKFQISDLGSPIPCLGSVVKMFMPSETSLVLAGYHGEVAARYHS